jgi:hypothetical protein
MTVTIEVGPPTADPVRRCHFIDALPKSNDDQQLFPGAMYNET